MDEPAPTDISREFLGTPSDQEPFCARPWRTLKVTMTGQTKICCDFFTRLPEFDWPSAKDFHRPDGMWNHPYLQHLRRTMGTAEEVPFCTLCLTKDKRSPEHAEDRARAKQESLVVYRSMEDAAHAESYRGSIAAHEPLDEHVLRLADGREIRPFGKGAAHYRRLVRSAHLFRRGRVLQVGASVPAVSPFLAEANDHLTIVATEPGRLVRPRQLCAAFDLEPQTAVVSFDAALPFSDGEFDAVWVDGTSLQAVDRRRLLAEVARVVREGGPVHVRRAPGPGALLRAAASASGTELEEVLAVLRAGTDHDGALGMFTVKDVRHVVHRCGLKLDVALPLGPQWVAPTVDCPDQPAAVQAELAQLASAYAVEPEPGAPPRIEESLSFTALRPPRSSRRVAEAPEHVLGMPTVRPGAAATIGAEPDMGEAWVTSTPGTRPSGVST